MYKEKRGTAQTKSSSRAAALTWTQREKPLRCAAAIGIEAPAMKPAMQAVAWRARTSELRQRIGSRSAGSDEEVRPGRWIGVRSGVSSPATTQTAPSRARAIARLSASQARSTCHRCRLQASRVSRVSRIPCEKTFWLVALIAYNIGNEARGFESARSVFPL